MKTYMGIDLGSTTTKAVLLDEEGAVLGRGITNTRADYDVATGVARAECLNQARLTLLQRACGLPRGSRAGARLEAGLSLTEDLLALDRLAERFEAEAPPHLSHAVSRAIEALRAEAPSLFEPGGGRFFRDAVGSRFLDLAERIALEEGVPFEQLMGLYDRVILQVENEIDQTPFAELVERALDHAGLDDATAERVRAAIPGVQALPLEPDVTVGTGYGRQRLPFPKEWIRSEILCHGLGAHAVRPETRTVLDIGGQDTKAIQVDERGDVTGFQMNDRCAAGCGRYLGYVADEMNLGLHELGPLALKATHPVKVSSTCTVFAGVEVRELLAAGHAREDILAGLHRAIVLRAMSLLARSGGVHDQLTFTGGVARNEAVVATLTELVHDNYGDVTINVDPDSIYAGAHGAAIFARRAGA